MTQTTPAPKAIVVGTAFGCRVHVPALRAAGFEVAGLVGANPERTAQRAEENNISASFTDLDQAIRQTGACAVTIASPPATHAPLTDTALSHGCHVICEKPMANSLEEAAAMLEAAEKAGVIHLIGHQFRWNPERATVARALQEGMIGEPRFLTSISYLPLLADPDKPMPDWWFDTDAGGGWLGAHGSHLIDQVRSWLGDFESVSASLPIVSDREGVAEDSYSLRFRLANGVEGTLQHTAGAWGGPSEMIRVAGTGGTLWIENGNVFIADREGTRPLPVPDDLILPPVPEGQAGSHTNPGPYTRLCEVLLAGVENRSPDTAVTPPTFADGLACMQVMEAIRDSAANRGKLITL